MRELISGDLTFRNFNKDECTSNQESDEKQFYQFCIDQLNTWTDESIIKGLELENEPLGNSLKDTYLTFKKPELYFIFKQQELVATTLLTPESPLYDLGSLLNYVDHCNHLKINKVDNFMSLKKALEIIKNANSNSCYINCLAVNPVHQHKGIGSQALSTLSKNIDFFAPPSTTSLIARIRKDNVASESPFKKNGFETFFKMDLSDYNTFYKEL